MGCSAEDYSPGKCKMRTEPMSVPVTNIVTHVQLQDLHQALWLISPTVHVAIDSVALVLGADPFYDFPSISCKNVI